MTERIAVISDIHGNIWALEAVLAEIALSGITRILNLGDSLYGPLRPRETAERIRNEGFPSIAGNEDRLILEAENGPPHNFTIRENLEALDSPSLDWLRTLPSTLVSSNLYLCHGSPGNDCAYLCEDVTDRGVILKETGKLADLLTGLSQSIILCGHSHVPRVVSLPNGKTVINPGSVGLPAYEDDVPRPHKMEAGRPDAAFTVITLESGRLMSVQPRWVTYDRDAAVREALHNNRPDWARWLATGRA
jgi:predicted phosphodiesterase